MTLRFYNGEYRFVLVDTEVHRCTDVVRQMQWRRPSCLASVNFIALIYLGILCFSVVTPKVAAQGTPVAPSASGNITSDITEMFTVTTFSSTYQFSTDIGKNLSVTENETNSENCMSEIFQSRDGEVKEIFCKWRTDHLKYCYERSNETDRCEREFWERDDKSRDYFARYEKVLQRYDCNPEDNYSMWQCEDCRNAYKDWLCATQIPYHDSDNEEILPCEDFCIRTEARCPYFLPQKTYCGQRTFFCRGPRETARSRSKMENNTHPSRCFTCNFTQEVTSIEEMGCQCQWIVQNSSSSSSGAVASSLHHMGSTYAVLHALNLYILVMWTITPTVVAGT